MTKIAIDARFYGTIHTGLGRYTTNVLKYLPKYLKNHTLQVLLRKEGYGEYKPAKNVEKVLADIPHYSFAEQLQLPLLLKSISSDLLYTFHLNVPIMAGVPSVITIHDLIKSHFTGRDTTTRSPGIYALKRLGYNLVLKRALSNAKDIIVPTNTVKNEILSSYPTIKPEHVHPIPEAPDEIFRSPLKSNISLLESKMNLPSKFILFVGNAYPHKNIKVLLEAFRELKDPSMHLVIVAGRTPFFDRTLAPYDPRQIHVFSQLSDAELVQIYKQAQVLVTPSLMEGYGLVGLEALMVGTPVIASQIPVYREVYGDAVTYFDPHSVQDLVRSIKVVRRVPRSRPLDFSRTWDDVARSIAEVINARMSGL